MHPFSSHSTQGGLIHMPAYHDSLEEAVRSPHNRPVVGFHSIQVQAVEEMNPNAVGVEVGRSLDYSRLGGTELGYRSCSVAEAREEGHNRLEAAREAGGPEGAPTMNEEGSQRCSRRTCMSHAP